MKPVLIHSAARAEWEEAIVWYNHQVQGLGLDLESEVEIAIRKIQKNPEICPPYKQTGFRKKQVARFPYLVFFMELEDYIWVVAIANSSRQPDFWIERQLE